MGLERRLGDYLKAFDRKRDAQLRQIDQHLSVLWESNQGEAIWKVTSSRRGETISEAIAELQSAVDGAHHTLARSHPSSAITQKLQLLEQAKFCRNVLSAPDPCQMLREAFDAGRIWVDNPVLISQRFIIHLAKFLPRLLTHQDNIHT
jgi:hypothetical protein